METKNEPGSAEPVQPAPTPPPAPAPELPRAAATVIEGKTPREIKLEEKLAKASETIKGHELSIMDLQDRQHQLKQLNQPPRKKKSSPATFFHETED